MKKRLLAAFLAVAMVLSFMPFSAFATDAVSEDTSTATPAITVGENYYVFDADDFNGATFKTTLPADEGIDAAAVAGTQYIGIRIKIDDATAKYQFQNSRFQVSLKLDGAEYRIDTGNTTALLRNNPNYFVDYSDASLSKFFTASSMWNVHTKGIESVGSVDGVMLFPIAGNPSITEELLAKLEGVTLTFFDEAASGNIKKSSWDNKTVYIGDVSFVDDYNAYYEEYIAATGKDKYNLNNGGTAQIFTKVGPFRSYYRNYGVNNKIGTLYAAEGAVSDYDYTSGETVVHTSTLSNGDRAAALRYNTDTNIVPYFTLEQLNDSLKKDYQGPSTAINAAYVAYVQDSYRNGMGSDSRYDQKGGPLDASNNPELDVTGIQYVAIRMAITGGDENAWVMWNVSGINADGSSRGLKEGNYDFIDIESGKVSQLNLTSNRITTTGSIDGYLIVPLSMLSSTADISGGYANIRFIQFSLTRGFYDGKTFYAGNSYFVDDYTKFKASLSAPTEDIEYTATNDSITVTNAPVDGSIEYSVDGKNWVSATADTAATITGLKKDTKYTLSQRYKGYTMSSSIEAWTSPHATHLGDTASYLMNVYDVPTEMWGSNNGNGINSPIHYASNDFATNSGGYGNNQCIYVKEFHDETFIEFDMDEAKLTGNKQIRVYYNAFEDLELTSQLGVSELIDTTNVNYLAYRLKVTGGEEDTVSKLGICWGNGTFPLKDLRKAFVIDNATKEIYTPESWDGKSNMHKNVECFTFDGDFDGWIVIPFDCIQNSSGTENSVKDIILGRVEGKSLANLTGVRDIQFNFYHDGTTTDWTNRNLYVGDVLVLEDAETFARKRGYKSSVDVNGTKYESLAEAMAAVQDDETITLMSDILLFKTGAGSLNGINFAGLLYFGDKNFTLDLNGKTISAVGDVDNDVLRFINRGEKDNTITITNGNIIAHKDVWQAVDVGGTYATPQDGKTTLILDGLNITTYKGGASAVRCRTGNLLKVYNTTINTNAGGGVYTDGGSTILGDGVNITVGGPSGVGDYGVAINSCASVSNTGNLTIEGGTYTNHRNASVEYVISLMYSGATVEITGGTFIGGRGGMIGVGALENVTANLTITGGTFKPNSNALLIYREGFPGTNNITVGTVKYNSATVEWAGMTFGDGTTYTVEVNDEVVASDIESTSYELENLEPATTYNVRIMMKSRGATAIMTSTFTTPEAPEHNYNAVVTDPTCTEAGFTTYTCTECGDSYVETIDATGHSYESVTVAPTKNDTGYTVHTCANCGDLYYSDAKHSLSGRVQNVSASGDIELVTITWDALTAVDRYIVYIYDMDGNLVKCAQKATNRAAFAGIEAGDYVTLVIAKTSSGWYEFLRAYEVAFTVSEAEAEEETSPKATIGKASYDSVTITWDAVEGATKYSVMLTGGGKTIYHAASTNSITVYGLESATEYAVSVNAKTTDGYIGYGEATSFETAANPDVTLTITEGITRYTLKWQGENVDKVWIKYVANGTTTQIAVVIDKDTYNVAKDVAGDYYVVARVAVDGAYRYVNSNIVTVD